MAPLTRAKSPERCEPFAKQGGKAGHATPLTCDGLFHDIRSAIEHPGFTWDGGNLNMALGVVFDGKAAVLQCEGNDPVHSQNEIVLGRSVPG